MKRAVSILLLFVAGCAPDIYPRTPPPPTMTLYFESDHDRLKLTQGVATGMAVSCLGTCQGLRAWTDAPTVAQIYPAHLGTQGNSYYESAASTDSAYASGLVLAGLKPGETTLHVSDRKGRTRDYAVTVLPVP
jgi:outer membrane protein assembly factor BamB